MSYCNVAAYCAHWDMVTSKIPQLYCSFFSAWSRGRAKSAKYLQHDFGSLMAC